jgi:membrane protein DedA with SNARE-associated domain
VSAAAGAIGPTLDEAELILGQQVGPWLSGITEVGLYALLGALAALKAVVPPFPGDSLVLVVATVVGQGGGRLPLAALATCAGGVLGVVGVHEASRRLGGSRGRPGLMDRALRPEHTERLARLHERYGIWAYFLGRFLPGVRHVLPLFAGASGAPRRIALLPICAATVLWYGALVLTGGVAGEALARALREGRFPTAAVVLLAISIAVLLLLNVRGWRWLRGGGERS